MSDGKANGELFTDEQAAELRRACGLLWPGDREVDGWDVLAAWDAMKALQPGQLPEDLRAMLAVVAEAGEVIADEAEYLRAAFRLGWARWDGREIVDTGPAPDTDDDETTREK